ncbi:MULTISPECIES: gamma-glutamylcyclotransferase family protein [Flavobacterium]|uniref:Gamma-glutamylcyclotransferase n=2 Tax=Flavobacterium TaxID=237 RepID=A0AA94F2S0_9FLAO|nr:MULTISPECIES: gamma-glutamylcyclotransferase family protein [Flavobacterium]OXA75088.1 UDP-N-acetylmuramate--alanine ligase [Flavobacterium columnare NBRC 100251 = ATCC 23463]AMA48532.1 UDP-N-acetylmuramate--alanine ligase [Flavobacterium covae]AND65340.1 UDP-N-acetylmuramate--alanine ligase [Flavobacterium covae]MCH4830481.1 gamma-glutamylcyclotransferase [Flavobacterium columnare]MCH4833582.1 gamma-glutamylcyclotransferase [Flavobacterium columnare]
MKDTIHLLFSYGTLQLEKVQLENYGRILAGQKDVLKGYKIENLLITDPKVLAKSELEQHPIAVKTENKSDFIKGMIFEISSAELEETDRYEVDQYQRIEETFESGKKAWIYVEKTF